MSSSITLKLAVTVPTTAENGRPIAGCPPQMPFASQKAIPEQLPSNGERTTRRPESSMAGRYAMRLSVTASARSLARKPPLGSWTQKSAVTASTIAANGRRIADGPPRTPSAAQRACQRQSISSGSRTTRKPESSMVDRFAMRPNATGFRLSFARADFRSDTGIEIRHGHRIGCKRLAACSMDLRWSGRRVVCEGPF